MTNYHAYLIRFWREDARFPWRAELESPHTGEQRRFASPEQLFAFVQQQMKDDDNHEGVDHKPDTRS